MNWRNHETKKINVIMNVLKLLCPPSCGNGSFMAALSTVIQESLRI